MIKFNLATPKDFLMEDDKDISETDAEIRINENMEYNKNFNINDFKQAQNVEKTDKITEI